MHWNRTDVGGWIETSGTEFWGGGGGGGVRERDGSSFHSVVMWMLENRFHAAMTKCKQAREDQRRDRRGGGGVGGCGGRGFIEM